MKSSSVATRVFRIVAITALFAAIAHRPSRGAPVADLDRLVAWMSGSFSSQEQAAADPDYRDIRLHMAPIWKDRADGHWLYVEQAVASSADKPYRQRVYHVIQRADGSFESSVFKLPGDPLKYAGAWKNPAMFSELKPSDLEPRTGCSIVLTKKGDLFEGSTTGKECPSDLRGAVYATSEVRIESSRMVSWDRGFDEKGEQVWGAAKAGYEFKKIPE
jgi:hypothetical protein